MSRSLDSLRHQRRGDAVPTLVVGAVAGATAAYAKSLAEPPLQRLGERLFPPRPAQLELRGADGIRHPSRMPPALLVRRVVRRVTGGRADPATVERSVTTLHYVVGVCYGLLYCFAVRRRPGVSLLGGTVAGAGLWAATHGSTLPAARLQASPTRMPGSWYVWELGSHLAFGAAVEATRRVGLRVISEWSR